MILPKVTELSAVSAHRREVALVRWSLAAVGDTVGDRVRGPDPGDPLRAITDLRSVTRPAATA